MEILKYMAKLVEKKPYLYISIDTAAINDKESVIRLSVTNTRTKLSCRRCISSKDLSMSVNYPSDLEIVLESTFEKMIEEVEKKGAAVNE